MKLKMVVFAETILFLCLSMTSLFAQTEPSVPPSAEQVVTQPAINEDIDALKKKIETMKLQQERMHNTDLRVHRAETEKLGREIADANAKLDAMNREMALREQETKKAQAHDAYVTRIYLLLSASGVAVLLILGAIFFVRRGRKVQSMKEVSTPEVETLAPAWSIKDIDDPFSLLASNIHVSSLPIDPLKEKVVEYEPAQNGTPFIIILKLASGLLVPCIIQKVDGIDGKVPLVFHTLEGFRTSERKPNSSWKQRKRDAEIVRRPDYKLALTTDSSEAVMH